MTSYYNSILQIIREREAETMAVMFGGIPYVKIPDTAEKVVVIRGDQTFSFTLPDRQSDAPQGSVIVETKDDVPLITTNTEPLTVEATPTGARKCLLLSNNGSCKFSDCPCHKKAPQGDNKQ